MHCTHCGSEVPEGARSCPTCGAPFAAAPPPAAVPAAIPTRSKALVLVFLAAGLIALLAAVAAFLLMRVPVDSGNGGARAHEVTYKVASTTLQVNLTYGPDGREDGARVPWEKSVVVHGDQALSLSATVGTQAGGRVFCEIWVDGVLVARENSRLSVACVGQTE